MPARTLKYLPLDELRGHPDNPKNHLGELIGASIDRFGYVEPQVLDERTGLLAAGHGRLDELRAKQADGKEVPDGIRVVKGRWLVPVVHGWSSADDREALAYLVASNQSTIAGGWDLPQLGSVLDEIRVDDGDLAGTGYDAGMLDDLLEEIRTVDLDGDGGPPRPGPPRLSTWQPTPPTPREAPVAVSVLPGDCVTVLADLEEASVDAVVTDPPYNIEFMGRDWDGAGVAFNPATWAAVLRVLKPGGHVLSFGGSRTYHRMVVAMEDAGFEIRDSVHWLYGSGFPKSQNVSKAIGVSLGVDRPIILGSGENYGVSTAEDGKVAYGDYPGKWDVTAPASPDAVRWDGWGTGLKPAHEPIVVARKPFPGPVAANVLEHGTGALNIDGARPLREVDDTSGWSATGSEADLSGRFLSNPHGREPVPDSDLGRWPPNVVLSHLEDCTEQVCVEGCAVAELDQQSGETSTTARNSTVRPGHAEVSTYDVGGYRSGALYGDSGGASRFFPTFAYIPKASTAERNAGLDALPEREVNDALNPGDPGYDNPGAGAGAGRGGAQANFHPTVKPVALMRWLVRLITPPGGTVLDPFAGSGSTLVAAILEGFNSVGCELTDDYLPIINARIEWAQSVAHPEPAPT